MSCKIYELYLFMFSQEATTITLAAATSHSVIPRTFSGNSLVAEIRLQIFSVSPAADSCFFFKEWKESVTEQSHKSGEHPVAIINFITLSGQKYTDMT